MLQTNNKKIEILEAEKQHAPAIIVYVKKVADETDFLTFGSDEFNKSIEEEESIIEHHKKSENRIFIIAILNDEIIGLLNVAASPKKRLEHIGEFGLSVLKAHWNKGVGSLLVKHMIDWAQENNVTRKINLKVLETNESAIRLYEKLGFEKEGLFKRDFYLRGKFQNSIVMGLIID